MIVKLLTVHHLEFLSLKGGCRGSSECTHIKMPHYWKSHALAQIISLICLFGLVLCRNWVQRAFMSVKDADEKKDEMENILRQKLTDAFTSGLAWKINWDVEPLPL